MKHALTFLLLAAVMGGRAVAAGEDYSALVLADKPIAYWRLDASASNHVTNLGSLAAETESLVEGNITFKSAGPQPPVFPDFAPENLAAGFDGKNGFIRVKDTAKKNSLAFPSGDTLTIEAWVANGFIGEGKDLYVIGKGRTQNEGFAANNQNWSLRVHGKKGRGHLSFLFRDARNLPNGHESWHRWISTESLAPDSGWHRVVMSYTFGKGDSARAWIDATEVKGRWDYGGKTDLAPLVDNDEVWLGSSLGGAVNSTWEGSLKDVAIYRGEITSEQLAKHYHANPSLAPKPAAAPVAVAVIRDPPADHTVRMEILEYSGKKAIIADTASVGADSADDAPTTPASIANGGSWQTPPTLITDEYHGSAFALAALPTKYSDKGIKLDRSAPFLTRTVGRVTLPAGEYHLLLRSHNAARLLMDGHEILATPFVANKHADAEEVPDQAAKSVDGVRILPPGHSDQMGALTSDGKPHTFVFEAFVGGRSVRPEVGETCVAVAGADGVYHLLAPQTEVKLIDEDWQPFAAAQKQEMAERDVKQRRVVAAAEDKYWVKRHEEARKIKSAQAALAVPAPGKLPANNAVDNFINQKILATNATPSHLTDDDAFLRRVTLDTVGLIPTPEQIDVFKKDKSPDRRSKAIETLLASPGWADHWVSYWQDVLAENPGMLKPTLNNTGPFRWFIYDSFRDNKPMDRFVTELVAMEGSLYSGGPAGFSMASENDVPMAAKAHIVSKAFMAMELQCARCHDAPYHPFKQEQLFSLAAMLKRAPQKVPTSSSIPTNTNIRVGRLVQVTLLPGSVVKPAWPFTEVVNRADVESDVRHHGDTREELAALITDPRNQRFPQVIVNRIWKRYMGWGLVEPVDDWPTKLEISHPELLAWLAREFVMSGYDTKHIARLILNSQAYQRVAQDGSGPVPEAKDRLFEAPTQRRMTAEQLVDSLFAAVGKSFNSEELNQDADGRRPAQDFNNLGIPKRSWELCSLANERDRPALALPRAQAIVDTLIMFGWRESRPNPLTERDHSPNVLQPAHLENSTLAARITRLSDDGAVTRLALQDQPLPDLIREVFARVLSRPPTADEMTAFTTQLEPGYTDRKVANNDSAKKKAGQKQTVSWSNHLNAEATKIKLEEERSVRAGDPPTAALRPEWRERMEDVVWAMVNSPEFIYVP